MRLPMPSKGSLGLTYGHHALKAAQSDRYGVIRLPGSVEFAGMQVVEAEFYRDCLQKLVVRVRYCERFDLVLVLGGTGFVRTVWLNERSDKHSTLDRSKYQVWR